MAEFGRVSAVSAINAVGYTFHKLVERGWNALEAGKDVSHCSTDTYHRSEPHDVSPERPSVSYVRTVVKHAADSKNAANSADS